MIKTILPLILISCLTIVHGQTKVVYIDYFNSNNDNHLLNSNCNECTSEGIEALQKSPTKNKVILYDNLINNLIIITKGQNSQIHIFGYNDSYEICADKYIQPYTIHKIAGIQPAIGKRVKIYVYEINSNNKILVDSIILVPQTFKFQLNLNVIKPKNKIKSNELLLIDSLVLKTEKPISPKIIGFEINWYGVGMDGGFKSNSNHLTLEMKEYLKSVKTNKNVYLEKIKLKMPDGTIKFLEEGYLIEF